MVYSFEKFSGFNARSSDPTISITKNDTFGLSSAFFTINNLDKYDFACLYYDARNKAIGVRFTNDQSEKSKFAVMKNKASSGANIIARSFFKKNSIDSSAYVDKYIPKKLSLDEVGINEPGAMFVIDLKG